MTTETDLLPCPFCGGTEIHIGPMDPPSAWECWVVGCNNDDCPLDADSVKVELGTQEKAAAAWNTRATDANLDALQAENERLREANAEMQKEIARAWNDGFLVAMKGCGWQEGEDPSTEGLYVVRDSKGNVEVGLWCAKTFNSQPAQWAPEFQDVDRDDIVAWMAIPDWRTARDASKLSEAMLRAREASND